MPYVRVLPIRPGKTAQCKQFIAELTSTHVTKFAASQQAEGITVEHFFLQADAKGDLLIIYNDGDSIKREHMRQVRSSSDDPFDVWFREQFHEVHGIALDHPTEGGPRIEHLASWEDHNR